MFRHASTIARSHWSTITNLYLYKECIFDQGWNIFEPSCCPFSSLVMWGILSKHQPITPSLFSSIFFWPELFSPTTTEILRFLKIENMKNYELRFASVSHYLGLNILETFFCDWNTKTKHCPILSLAWVDFFPQSVLPHPTSLPWWGLQTSTECWPSHESLE